MKRFEAKPTDLSADSYSRLFPVQIRRLQHRFIAASPRPDPEKGAPAPPAPPAAGRRTEPAPGQSQPEKGGKC